jgi:hypothetical protein
LIMRKIAGSVVMVGLLFILFKGIAMAATGIFALFLVIISLLIFIAIVKGSDTKR